MFLCCTYYVGFAQKTGQNTIVVGAAQFSEYEDMIKNRAVGFVGNHTSLVNGIHLLDSLLARGIEVKKLFSPEHGFRGDADAGELVDASVDSKTNLPIVSLYGKHKKPTSEDLQGLNVMLFDLQDVGTRFYTYISTMHLVMEACAENNVPLIILDRPNPNGHYIDGPVLEARLKSFVGMHEVPIVHGMTVGEYALMINGEGWLAGNRKCDLRVIKVKGYDHSSTYELEVKPSPNLPNMASVYLYPSLCLFEGTSFSIGRGTDFPFQVFGHPSFFAGEFTFTPRSIAGASKHPKLEGEKCIGVDLRAYGEKEARKRGEINLRWLIKAYSESPEEVKKDFFNNYFNTLAGTGILKQQIKDGLSEEEIKRSWAFGIERFKKIREKYLLYKDFEFRISIDP